MLTGLLGGVYEWEAASGKLLRGPWDPGAYNFEPLALSANGKYMARWDRETGRISLLDGQTEKDLMPPQLASSIQALAISPDGKFMATAGTRQDIQIWDPTTGREIRQLDALGGASFLYFSSDGKTLYSNNNFLSDEYLGRGDRKGARSQTRRWCSNCSISRRLVRRQVLCLPNWIHRQGCQVPYLRNRHR
jgi:WD40 repeat protein